MPGNQLTNAGFVEGATGWGPSGGSVISVDETIRGFDGRFVLKATKVLADAEFMYVASGPDYAIPVIAGQTLEVFGHHAFTRGASSLFAVFVEVIDGVESTQIPIPVQNTGDGDPRLGLSKSMNFSHARIIAPLTGFVRLFAYGTASSAGASELFLMKPYIEVVSPKTKYRCWDPGSHINPDLNIPHWPSELPHIRADSFSVPIIPTRRPYAGDNGVTITKKLVSTPWYKVQATIKTDQETHAILDQFFRLSTEPFWFVRPDTLQLCQATWLSDGEPSQSGLGADKFTEFGLQIRVY